jgi:hypothetical protein
MLLIHPLKGTHMNTSFGKLIIVFALTTATTLLPGCTKNETVVGNNQIVGSGKLVSQERSAASFNGIQITNFANVIVTQDTVEHLRIESDDNVINLIMTSVNGSNLVVGLENGSYNNVTVNVYVSMKTVRRLESVGTADFSTTNPIQTDSLVCRITGAGNITLTGTTVYEQVEIVGAGNVHNFDLISSRCATTISGSGNIEVNATARLNAIIAGAGSIVYAGNPQTVQQSVTGVGSIRPR